MPEGSDATRRSSRPAACTFRRDSSPWDALAGAPDADSPAVLLPPLLAALHLVFPELKGRDALDIGCGTGALCGELHARGCRVSGCDTSSAMLARARAQLPAEVQLVSDLPPAGEFDIITAVMLLPFIADAGALLQTCDRLLARGGVCVIVVQHPPFVLDRARRNDRFAGLTATLPPPQQGTLLLQETRLPYYLRSADDYRTRAHNLGWLDLLSALPPHPPELPEYLLLAFRKP